MQITVGIPTYNRTKYWIQTTQQILDAQHSTVCEIFIVDQTPNINISSTESLLIQKIQQHPLVNYIKKNEPSSGAARNHIIKYAKGEIILFLDDDVLLAPNFIEEHYKIYTTSTMKIIAVAGLIFHRTVTLDIHPDNINFSNYKKYTHPHDNEKAYTENWKKCLVGANFSVLKSHAIFAGGFDENYIPPALLEEDDFTKRLQQTLNEQQTISYTPKAYLIHLRASQGGNRIEQKKQTEIAITLGYHIYAWRHLEGINRWKFFLQTIRYGPLRKENVLKLWKQPLVWYAFFSSMFKAYLLKNNIKSPFRN